jgi:hypothetical protein
MFASHVPIVAATTLRQTQDDPSGFPQPSATGV